MTTRLLPFPAMMRRIALLAAAVALLFAAPLHAGDYTSLAGVKAAGFQKWIDDAKDQGYGPWYVNGYEVGDHAEFAGVAVKETVPYAARFDMTADEFQQWCDEMSDKGYRPRSVSGYMAGKSPRFAGAWIKDNYKGAWKIRHNQGQKDFDAAVTAMRKDGLEPACVTAYQGADGAVRYTAIFHVRGPHKWEYRYNLTADKYQDLLDRWTSEGLRPLCVAAYDTPDGLRYLATAEVIDDNLMWQEHHSMSGKEYQDEFDTLGKDGWRPWCICGYREDGEVRFAVVWIKKK